MTSPRAISVLAAVLLGCLCVLPGESAEDRCYHEKLDLQNFFQNKLKVNDISACCLHWDMLDDGKCKEKDCHYKCVSWKEEGTASRTTSSTYTNQDGCTVSCEARLYCNSWSLVKPGYRGMWQDNTYKCNKWSTEAPKQPKMCRCLKAATKPECDFAELAKKYIESHQDKEACKQAAQSGSVDTRNKCANYGNLFLNWRHDVCQLKSNKQPVRQVQEKALADAIADIKNNKGRVCGHLRKHCPACANNCHEYDACKTLRTCSEALKTCLP